MQAQPGEDIDAVLGRFQAWSGSSNAAETKAGIRELSYEDALRSRRYRWKAGGESPAKNMLEPERSVAPMTAPESQPQRVKSAPAQGRTAKLRTANRVWANNNAAKAAPVSKTAGRVVTKPEFREVLVETVQPPEVILAAVQPIKLPRQVALSIRLAPAERMLIRTRAAEAGISASAYMRQCALEVEQLRAQVQRALAAIERQTPALARTPLSAPGYFSRLIQRIFPGRYTKVTLPA